MGVRDSTPEPEARPARARFAVPHCVFAPLGLAASRAFRRTLPRPAIAGDSRFGFLVAFADRPVHRGNALAARPRPVCLYDRRGSVGVPRRRRRAALQPDSRVAGAGGLLRGLPRRRLSRSGGVSRAAAGGLLRPRWPGGVAAFGSSRPRLDGRSYSGSHRSSVRARPAAVPHVFVPCADGGDSGIAPAVMAAPAIVFDLGQLPRRLLPGLGGAGGVLRRSASGPLAE